MCRDDFVLVDWACVENGDTEQLISSNNTLKCAESFFATGTTCGSGTDICLSAGGSYSVCDSERRVQCDGDVVFENGAWRASWHGATDDRNVCKSCDDGALRFNAMDCVPDGDCAPFVNGVCAECRDELVLLPRGTCGEACTCVAHTREGSCSVLHGCFPKRMAPANVRLR